MSEENSDSAKNSHFENKVILIAIIVGFVGSIIIYLLSLPAIMVSIFLATGIAALVYRFLGGATGASMVMGTLKLSGSIAVLLGSAYFINGELIKQSEGTGKVKLGKISFNPHRSNWVAFDKSNGKPITVKINETDEELPTPAKNIWKNNPLQLTKSGNRFLIVPENDTSFTLGTIEVSSLGSSGFFSKLEKTERFVVTERLNINQRDFLAPFHFSIKPTAFANEFSRFQLIDKTSDEVIYENQIYRRSYLIDQIQNKTYLIWVVEVKHQEKDPNDEHSSHPYVKFAITELSLKM